jgi:hypothetical protein
VIKLLRNPVKRASRRAWPIHAYVGANGGGKSAAAVWDTLPTLEQGRPVLSTVRILDYRHPRECTDDRCAETNPAHFLRGEPEVNALVRRFNDQERTEFTPDEWMIQPEELGDVIGVHQAAHPLWVPFTDWRQLLSAVRCDVIMDEVTGVASSRESHSMPPQVANFLVQLRRRDVVVRWTAPSWPRADKIIRECTQAVTYCEGSFGIRATDANGDRQWRNRRLFKWRTFDANAFEDFTAGKREAMSAMTVDHHWGPGSPTFSAYDTFDSVLAIGSVSDSGRCADCGGRRSAPACSCVDYQRRKRGAKTAEEGPPKGDTAAVLASRSELVVAGEVTGS